MRREWARHPTSDGLPDIQAVYDIVFDASYMVLGLGDVYLGAPVATPLDPRHRLVTTKYNPARTWTPENAVGIGGAYLCVYGMEGPGGYQFVGRTVQMCWRETREFTKGKPWLLRFFDQIRFYPMGAEELLEYRKDFVAGRVSLRIEDGVFRLSDYQRFFDDNAASIQSFKHGQQAAFEAERDAGVLPASLRHPMSAPMTMPQPATRRPRRLTARSLRRRCRAAYGRCRWPWVPR